MHRRAGGNHAVTTDPDTRSDDGAWANARAAADFDISANDGHRLDLDTVFKARRRIDKGCRRDFSRLGRHANRRKPLRMQKSARKRKCRMGTLGDENGNMGRYQGKQRLLAEDRCGLAGREFFTVAARENVANIPILRPSHRRNGSHDPFPVALILQFRPRVGCKRSQGHPGMGRKEMIMLHQQTLQNVNLSAVLDRQS